MDRPDEPRKHGARKPLLIAAALCCLCLVLSGCAASLVDKGRRAYGEGDCRTARHFFLEAQSDPKTHHAEGLNRDLFNTGICLGDQARADGEEMWEEAKSGPSDSAVEKGETAIRHLEEARGHYQEAGRWAGKMDDQPARDVVREKVTFTEHLLARYGRDLHRIRYEHHLRKARKARQSGRLGSALDEYTKALGQGQGRVEDLDKVEVEYMDLLCRQALGHIYARNWTGANDLRARINSFSRDRRASACAAEVEETFLEQYSRHLVSKGQTLLARGDLPGALREFDAVFRMDWSRDPDQGWGHEVTVVESLCRHVRKRTNEQAFDEAARTLNELTYLPYADRHTRTIQEASDHYRKVHGGYNVQQARERFLEGRPARAVELLSTPHAQEIAGAGELLRRYAHLDGEINRAVNGARAYYARKADMFRGHIPAGMVCDIGYVQVNGLEADGMNPKLRDWLKKVPAVQHSDRIVQRRVGGFYKVSDGSRYTINGRYRVTIPGKTSVVLSVDLWLAESGRTLFFKSRRTDIPNLKLKAWWGTKPFYGEYYSDTIPVIDRELTALIDKTAGYFVTYGRCPARLTVKRAADSARRSIRLKLNPAEWQAVEMAIGRLVTGSAD